MNNSLVVQDYNTKFFKNYLKVYGHQETAIRFYSQEEFNTYKFATRVLVIIYDKQDYDEELKDIKNAARFLANRDEVRLAILNDAKIIKKLKKETSWFSRSSFNSFIVKRYDEKVFVTDMINN